MTSLATRRCRPPVQGALAGEEIARLLAEVPAWAVVDGALERAFAFPDYARTIGFVNAVAWLAQIEDHHPDLTVGWGKCTVRWQTHAAKGLTINDFICAAKVDALLP